MKRFLALFLAALIALPPVSAMAASGCSYPTSLDSYSQKSTGDFLTVADVNSRSCAIEKLESGPLRPNDGSAGAPAYTFRTQANIGMYRPATDVLAFSVAGTEAMRINPAGTLSSGATNRFRMLQTMARAQTAVAQTIPNNTETALGFGSESTDTDTLHDSGVNPSRIIAKIAGKYIVIGAVDWAANNTGQRRARIRKNGATDYATTNLMPVSGATTNLPVAALVDLAANDYVELIIFQDSGGSLDAQGGSLAAVYVGE